MSLKSDRQLMLVLEKNDIPAAGAILYHHKRSLRIFSIAVLPDYQQQKLGDTLLDHVVDVARGFGYDRVSLEADSENKPLIGWYLKHGFAVKKELPDYYKIGEPAVRMSRNLETIEPTKSKSVKAQQNLIVVDQVKLWPFQIPNLEVVSAEQYLTEARFQNPNSFRVFNLCNSYKSHKLGYYVSLLASARDQKIIPNVTAIRDFSNVSIVQSITDDINTTVQESLATITDKELVLNVFFSSTPTPGFRKLAKLLYQFFELPLFQVTFQKTDNWSIKKVQILSFGNFIKENTTQIKEIAETYFQKKRFNRMRMKHYQYDLAILIDPEEKTAPSNPGSLKKFQEAADKAGFYCEFITKTDYDRICEFDALFIRETTAVDNHTYKFSRRAYAEGLIVMDDPWSILRCSNKMYLYERLTRNRVRQPRSWLLCKEKTINELKEGLTFPLVLKLPESSFSLGVFKVKDVTELEARLQQMFKTCEIVIAQEFMSSDFDWRIGILDNTPLYACKYHMASGHWQIYNWQKETASDDFSGNSENIPLNQVPASILQAATRASAVIGDGLYGVDLKEVKGKAYVIEVNDNPNIDHGVEDLILKDDLYLKIMTSFYNRIEKDRGVRRYVSFKED